MSYHIKNIAFEAIERSHQDHRSAATKFGAQLPTFCQLGFNTNGTQVSDSGPPWPFCNDQF